MAVAVQQPSVPAHELVYERQQLPKLRSNHGPCVDASSVGWMQETSVDTPLEEMRRRFNTDGYVFIKHLIPRETVLDSREEYFAHLAPTHILKAGTSPRDGIFNDADDPETHNGVGATRLPDGVDRLDLLESAHVLPKYDELLKHDSLHSFVRRFMGWKNDVLLTRTLLRHNVPNGFSTGIHYDKLFLRKGESEFLTAWVPIGDCTAEGGGLMYLENSQDIGRNVEADFVKRAEHFTPEERINAFNANMARDGQLAHNVDDFRRDYLAGQFGRNGGKRRWLAGNFEAGDVVFHNEYLIHGAVKNQDPEGRIRLSTDLRFYEEGSSLDERWMKVWKRDDGL
ncbi:hypothetical protein BDY17DRAFT_134811 [Neohortaea acidophila]|uniref:Phytanoyl-CoA dioxygenase n=1 Tax=Neohortaea acidophila TaxID=245834 RepID=A0A6A6PXH5_9PEZI|nr:uncharacterized protein BDY17DRAFT_134811 [Neohortaea acidophila]KAF2484742.1 hypothetical protein BDY17DRAFT_134811 [Neohortaea acidophila]